MQQKEDTQEKIGQVVLDHTWYGGTDLYSDGPSEEALLEVARTVPEEELNARIAKERDWTLLYHMSHVRENIISVLPIRADEQVLEIGSGCGAVTGALARRAAHVDCVDLSDRRSHINAWRHQDLDNIRILVGNFADIEPNLGQYDWITLIGVFEYGCSYIDGEDPYHTFLRLIARHLKARGHLAIAIENRLGLKYWAGCREDHSGEFFDGLENYPHEGPARTFSRPALLRLLGESGLECRRLYYPYPDYKLPQRIFSDEIGPAVGELDLSNWNFDRDRLALFDDAAVTDSLISDGVYSLFANSFLAVAGLSADPDTADALSDPAEAGQAFSSPEPDERPSSEPHGPEPEERFLPERETAGSDPRGVDESAPVSLYARFSNERSRAYSLETHICRAGRTRVVCKCASFPEGDVHIRRIRESASQLTQMLQGSFLKVNRVLDPDELIRTGTGAGSADLSAQAGCACVWLEYIPDARTLQDEALGLWRSGRESEAAGLIGQLTALIRSLAQTPFAVTDEFTQLFGVEAYPYEDQTMPVTDLDMIPENVMLTGTGAQAEATLIDYEWTCTCPVPSRYVIYRIWHYFLERSCPGEDHAAWYEREGITADMIRLFEEMEQAWQRHTQGDVVRLRELYAAMTPGIRDVRAEMKLSGSGPRKLRTLLFAGHAVAPKTDESGETIEFDTELSRVKELNIEPDGTFTWTLTAYDIGEAKALRWDILSGGYLRMRIDRITARAYVRITPMNAFHTHDEPDWDEFISSDVAYRIEGDLQGAGAVVIEGRLEFTEPDAETIKLEQMLQERSAYEAEMQSLRGRIAAMEGTKAYRGIEKLRQARNFMLARWHGLKIVGDKKAIEARYQQWLAGHSSTEQELQAQRLCRLEGGEKVSILVPLYDTPEAYLRAMIESVQAQTYPGWQLCLADGSAGDALKAIVDEYARIDARIVYRHLESNEGISGNTNAAAQMADGTYIALLDHDDLLAPDALYEMVQRLVVTGADMAYSDEDRVDREGVMHSDPNLKPDFAPDLLCSHNYITHFLVLRKALFDELGGLRSAFDGAQDYDLILRASERAKGIEHVPKILYYWRCHPGSTAENPKSKMYAYEAGRRAIEEHLTRTGRKGSVKIGRMWGTYQVTYETPGDPLVSVIIPNMDHTDDLDRCLKSLREVNRYENLEILVVENNSQQPATQTYYERMLTEDPRIRLLRWEKPFNYAAINNWAVSRAKGEAVLLLNNDTQMIEPDSIREMLGLCLREDTGCVGARLLYADKTIQHAGIILGPGGFAGHVFSGLPADDSGFMMRLGMTGNYSAVTGACLMVRREVYGQVQGMDEILAVGLNDVDFCLRVREAGYLNVYTPFACWYHYESKSRGYEDSPEKKQRLQREIDHFRQRWGRTVDAGDPYYNPNLSVNRVPFTLW